MSKSNSLIESGVREAIADVLNVDAEELNEDMTLEELGIDSFEGLLVLVAIERKFDIAISPDDKARISTLGEAVRLVYKYMHKGSRNG